MYLIYRESNFMFLNVGRISLVSMIVWLYTRKLSSPQSADFVYPYTFIMMVVCHSKKVLEGRKY